MFGGLVLATSGILLSATTGSSVSSTSQLACATQIVSAWSLGRIANETIVIPVYATNIGAMAPAARAGYGGLLLFGNVAPTSMPAIIATLQRERPVHYAMLVMTDEEGGGVMRLNNVVSAFPWAKSMGTHYSPSQIAAVASRVGRQLLSVGVNMDLAPVLDVDGRADYPGAANPDGLRSFSGTPLIVAADGAAFMKGLTKANVTSVVKHFPGLGYATRNTDYGPAATLTWARLRSTGLVPFKQAIADGAQAVMMSNARVPGLSALPAGLSPTVIQVLRQTLGFQGLIVTDSLSAGAISALHLAEPAAAVMALAAGADLILFGSPSSPTKSLALASQISDAVVGAVNSGALPKSTLIAAAAQVLATHNTLTCATPSTG